MKNYWQGALLGAFTGLAAGVAIGYLTAPQASKRTRRNLVDALNAQTDGLKAQWHKTIALAAEVVINTKNATGLFAQQAKHQLDYAKVEAKAVLQKTNFKQAYHTHVAAAADAVKTEVAKADEALTAR